MEQRGQDIIIRNFFRLIRSGAFNEYDPIERMSDFKWKKLIGMIVRQDVMTIAANGMRNSQYDNAGNIPRHIADSFFKMCQDCNSATKAVIPQSAMSNWWLNKRLRRIRAEERSGKEASPATLEMLNLIIYNTEKMLAAGVRYGNIILIGKYLRSNKQSIDYAKLERWLKQLRLQDMAEFEGNILISTLHFGQEEMPFVRKSDPKAYEKAVRSITRTKEINPDERLFREGQSGMVYNNASALRQNLWHRLKYLPYAPIETTSSFLRNIANSLSQIEE